MTKTTVENTTVVSQSVSYDIPPAKHQVNLPKAEPAADHQEKNENSSRKPEQSYHRKKSTYDEDYTRKSTDRRPLIIPPSNFVPPDEPHELNSHYQSEFTSKPITNIRAVRPFKPYTIPSQKMNQSTNYKDDFAFNGSIGKREPIKPQSDFVPPSDNEVRESSYKSAFCGENKTADRSRAVARMGEITLPSDPFSSSSRYKEDFVVQTTGRMQPVKPTSSFAGLADGITTSLPTTTYHSAFQQAQTIVPVRKRRPIKEFRHPTEKMAERSLYADEFQVKTAEKVRAVAPHSDFVPPSDHVDLKTDYQHTYNPEKPMQVERKKRPFKPYTRPEIKIEDKTTYVKDFVKKDAVPRLPIIPHGEYIMSKEKTRYESSYASEFLSKPVNPERRYGPKNTFINPTQKMDSVSTYGNDFQTKGGLPVTKVLPTQNSWFKMDHTDDSATAHSEYKSRFALIDDMTFRNAKPSPFAPGWRDALENGHDTRNRIIV